MSMIMLNNNGIRKNVVLIGVFPPPYGGVSVHIKRLYKLYVNAGHSVRVLCNENAQRMSNNSDIIPVLPSLNWKNILRRHWRILFSADVLYSHTSWACAPIMFLAAVMGKKCMLAFHNQMISHEIKHLPKLERLSIRIICSLNICEFLVVNHNISEILQDIGISKSIITVLPAYLPGDDKRNGKDVEIESEIEKYVSKHSPILVVYGWNVWLTSATRTGEQDLYGFNKSVDLLVRVRKKYGKAGLIISVPGTKIQGREYIEELVVNKDVMCIYKPIVNMGILWRKCDLYLRPTLSDGDSVAIREALAVGCQVVASDCAPRPNGVEVYSACEIDGLYHSTMNLLKREDSPPKSNRMESSISKYLELLQ